MCIRDSPDGFYELTADDAVAGGPEIFVRDDGSGTVFGPYPSGTVIKWTQAPGATPSEKAIGSAKGSAGAVSVHIIASGDMEMFAVDSLGNTSDPLSCYVPPPPK